MIFKYQITHEKPRYTLNYGLSLINKYLAWQKFILEIGILYLYYRIWRSLNVFPIIYRDSAFFKNSRVYIMSLFHGYSMVSPRFAYFHPWYYWSKISQINKTMQFQRYSLVNTLIIIWPCLNLIDTIQYKQTNVCEKMRIECLP